MKKTNLLNQKNEIPSASIEFQRAYQNALDALSQFATAANIQRSSIQYHSAHPLAQVIRDARTKQKLNQKELASLAKISVGTLVALEGGKKTAGFDTVERVLTALGLSLWIK